MRWFDEFSERGSRRLAQRTSRRSALARLGRVLFGAALVPLLPVDRMVGRAHAAVTDDPRSCDYWRHCGVDGWLCSCCGGSVSSCPPGTEVGSITWVGTCRNPADNTDYIVSYNDCCGKGSCGRCQCLRSEADTPVYRPQSSNDINWCLGTTSVHYHCTTSVVLGVARK